MATIALTVVPAKALKDGRNKVRIAVAHRSQTRYIVTDVTLNNSKEWKNGKVVKRDDATYLNMKLLKRMQEIQRIIDDLPYIEGLSCAELVGAITNLKAKKSHTLGSAFAEMMEVSNAKESSKNIYSTMFASITSVIHEGTLVRNITPLMLKRYVKKRSAELAEITIKNHLTLLSMIVNFCQANGYTDFRVTPTAGISKRVVAIRQNWLSPDQVRMVRDSDLGNAPRNRFRDIFMLSYYLGGINIIDIGRINFNESHDTLHYVRTKTERIAKVNPFVEFEIPDVAKQIIEKYKGADGYLHFCNRNSRRFSDSFYFLAKRVGESLGMPSLTFYSARKSFAQHAFMLGVSESVIDYVLGHSLGVSSNKMLFAYVKVTPDMATECVRKVCEFIASTRNF